MSMNSLPSTPAFGDSMDGYLHLMARKYALVIEDADKKQLRYNDIVRVAQSFYPSDPAGGVRELVDACDRRSPLHIPGRPMWRCLEEQYCWMRGEPREAPEGRA